MPSKNSEKSTVTTIGTDPQPEDYDTGSVDEVSEAKPTTWWARGLRFIELDTTAEAGTYNRWSNKDLDPVTPRDRTWRTYNCLCAHPKIL